MIGKRDKISKVSLDNVFCFVDREGFVVSYFFGVIMLYSVEFNMRLIEMYMKGVYLKIK